MGRIPASAPHGAGNGLSGGMAWPADAVERWPLDRLTAYAGNARTHSEEQIGQLVASIREWGWTNPVLVDEGGQIIAGHGRVLAARKLGLADAPVMVARGWSEAQKRAYVIADNKLALNSGWDEGLLRLELADLSSLGFDLSLTGFSDFELTALAAPPNAGLTDPDEVPPEPAVAASVAGDVWLLGRHRLVCDDGRDIGMVRRLCGDVIPDLANCDPPYGIKVVKGNHIGGAKPFGSQRGRVHGRARNAIIEPGVYSPIIGDDSTDTAIAAYETLVALGCRAIVLWGGNYFANRLPPSRCWLVWDKENTGTFADAELAWTNQDAVLRLLRHQWSGLIKASERGERRVHPTQKPVALAEWVSETMAPEGRTVIDLFLGSGSTLIACERQGRQCFAVEMSPAYVDVAVARWNAFTGESAKLEETGETLAELLARRQPEAKIKVTPVKLATRKVKRNGTKSTRANRA